MPKNLPLTSLILARCGRFAALASLLILGRAPSAVLGQERTVTPAAGRSIEVKKTTIDKRHPLYKLLEAAAESQKVAERVEDYQCVFTKREQVGKKLLKTTMEMKFREKPFSVYLKFLDLNKDREVIYVQGANNNNLLVHEGGFKAVLGTFSLLPTGPDAMAENRYPITSIGLKNMLDTVIKQWEAEAEFDGTKTKILPENSLPSGEICTVYESVHSQRYKEFKYQTTRLWIEDKTKLAIGVQQFGFPAKPEMEPPIVEEYFYSKVKTNLELPDTDFNKNNPTYAFK